MGDQKKPRVLSRSTDRERDIVLYGVREGAYWHSSLATPIASGWSLAATLALAVAGDDDES